MDNGYFWNHIRVYVTNGIKYYIRRKKSVYLDICMYVCMCGRFYYILTSRIEYVS